MANKETNNFKAALNELLSGKISTEENKPPLFKEDTVTPYDTTEETMALTQELDYAIIEAEAAEIEATEEILQAEKAVQEEFMPAENDATDDKAQTSPVYEVAPQVSIASMQNTVEQRVVGNETVIAHDVVIEGNIKSSSRLRIVGEVTGDVKSTADVVIEGKVGGSIQGNNIFLSECEVNNSITASNEVTISERSMINGDVKAGAVTSNGVINGNIDAQSVSLNSASRTVGNVKCKLIKIGEGAGLKGSLETID